MSAGQAIAAGADYVVVGRPISKADDPGQVIEALQEEIRQAANG
jgi:orotidine-5'-phosphate decarboxylase